jgi:hypothetical protein
VVVNGDRMEADCVRARRTAAAYINTFLPSDQKLVLSRLPLTLTFSSTLLPTFL